MIIQQDGHWRSVITPSDEKKIVDELLHDDNLSAREKEAVHAILNDMQDQSDLNLIDELTNDQWEEVPLPIEEWLDSSHHFGDIGASLYPKVREDIVSLFSHDYHECILTGCVDQDALVTCSDGSMPRLGDLIGKQTKVTTLDPEKGTEHFATEAGVYSGIRRVLHLTLRNGMDVKLTPDHKVFTNRGWVPAKDLVIEEDQVVVPRRLYYSPSCHDLTDDDVKLLAYWTTDGSSSHTRARFCDGRKLTATEVIKSLRRLGFNTTTSAPYNKGNSWEICVAKLKRSGFKEWMVRRGVFKMGAANAKVPDCICRAPLRQVALFINRVWAAEGTVAYRRAYPGRLQLGMRSKTFIRQIQLLLLRFGIQSRVYETRGRRNNKPQAVWTLAVSGKRNIELFYKEIGAIYAKEQETSELIKRVTNTVANTNCDTVPFTYGEAFRLLKSENIKFSVTEWSRLYNKNCQFSRSMFDKFCESFGDLKKVAALAARFNPDVAYTGIKKIEEVAQSIEVADIGVPGPHRFLANGINVHNSIGWGKTMFATTCIVRILYEMLCLKNPQKSLGIAPSEPIYVVPVSARKDLANKVAFGGIAGKLNVIDFFRGKFIETKEEVRFKDKKIFITGGSSNDAGVLGLNVICAMVDESNFFGKKKNNMVSVGPKAVYDKAQVIYNALVRRVKSRFQRAGVKGMIFLVSSKRSTSDFTERRIKEARDTGDAGVFVRDYASWQVTERYYKNQEWHRMLVSPETGRSRMLERDEPAPEDAFIIDFPNDFVKPARNDPEGFIRDIAGVALDNVKPFIANRAAIDAAMENDLLKPFDRDEWDTDQQLTIEWDNITSLDVFDEPTPLCCPGAHRHVHLDMSKMWDATGIAIAHVGGVMQLVRTDDETKEKYLEELPVIHVDGLLRVVAPVSGEIDHQKCRSVVYRLTKGGLPIRSVSMDQWCAPPNLQLFKKKGYRTDEISVDRKFDPYLVLRAALYEDRIYMAKYDVLRKELRELEITPNGKKIDHPPSGSKDLSDALTGAVYYLTVKTTPSGPAVAPGKGLSVAPPKGLSGGKAQPTGDGGFLWSDERTGDPNQSNDDLPCWIVL